MTVIAPDPMWPRGSEDIWLPSAQDVADDPRRAAEDFLSGEAALLDAGELERWLQLFAEDARYWVPLVWDAASPEDHLNLIYDDRRLLGDRIYRIGTGDAHSQDPPSRTVRCLANLRGRKNEGSEGGWVVHATFSLTEVRKDRVHHYSGRSVHVLRATAEGWVIARKRVDLAVSDQVLPNLTFLL